MLNLLSKSNHSLLARMKVKVRFSIYCFSDLHRCQLYLKLFLKLWVEWRHDINCATIHDELRRGQTQDLYFSVMEEISAIIFKTFVGTFAAKLLKSSHRSQLNRQTRNVFKCLKDNRRNNEICSVFTKYLKLLIAYKTFFWKLEQFALIILFQYCINLSIMKKIK